MSKIDQDFKRAIKTVLDTGIKYKDPERTGTYRIQVPKISIYAPRVENQIPILTSKHVSFKNVVGELLWFLRGETELTFLHQNNIHIWDKDFMRYTERGLNLPAKAYGYYWRNYQGIDQYKNMAETLKNNIWSTRNIIETWNPADIANSKVVLPPCHKTVQAIATSDHSFVLSVYQRSADLFLGVPYNILSYDILGRVLQKESGKHYDGAYFDFCAVHLYDNAIPSAIKLLQEKEHPAPTISINPNIDAVNNPKEIKISDFEIHNYKYSRKFKVEMK